MLGTNKNIRTRLFTSTTYDLDEPINHWMENEFLPHVVVDILSIQFSTTYQTEYGNVVSQALLVYKIKDGQTMLNEIQQRHLRTSEQKESTP